MNTLITHHYQQAFDKLSGLESLNGSHAKSRSRAFEALSKLQAPSRRDVGWSHLDLKSLNLHEYQLASAHPEPLFKTRPFDALPAFELTTYNGFISEAKLHTATPILFGKLADLTEVEWSFLIPPALDYKLNQSFIYLNQALSAEAAYVIIPPNTVIDEPIYIHHDLNAGKLPSMAHPRVVIICGEGSKITLIETYSFAGQAAFFSNSLTECHLAEGASLTHLNLQFGQANSLHFHTSRSILQKDSRYKNLVLNLFGNTNRHEQHILLTAPGAEVELAYPESASSNQHSDKVVYVHHQSPHCTSDIKARSVLKNGAKCALTARILVSPDAQKTRADLNHKALLLSPKTEAISQPELEIYADDVRCSHGSSVGQLDAETLFYMRSRGIEEKQAKALLIEAFLAPLMELIPQLPLLHLLNPQNEFSYE